ncbi:MAG: hypothetical protein IPL99_29310 [Candidatus Competibacteraceae bacterium]|nr:hypothetical protein [Candidatus Competibacteraceae bacterium]
MCSRARRWRCGKIRGDNTSKHSAWLERTDRKRAHWARRRALAFHANKGKQVLDPATGTYQDAGAKTGSGGAGDAENQESRRKIRRSCAPATIRRRNSCGRFIAMLQTTRRCCWQKLADNARDVDFAICWGFGWGMGPFEIWQAAGWEQVAT